MNKEACELKLQSKNTSKNFLYLLNQFERIFMNSTLQNYLSEMNATYDKVTEDIQNQFSENQNLNTFKLLFDNNEPLKKYISHLSIGTGLQNDTENVSALKEVARRHYEFMNFIYTIKNNTTL